MKLSEYHLKNQNTFRGEFVSVMDLVNYLAIDGDVTPGDAAESLLSLFGKSEASDRPRYGFADEINNSFVEMERIRGVLHLDDLLFVSAGTKPAKYADDADHFGWIREELLDFFKNKEIDPPIGLPDWKGTSCLDNSGDHQIEYPTPDDFDHEHWPEELGIAFMAWRVSTKADLSETTPKESMKKWIKENYAKFKDAKIERIATVANWDKAPGRPKKNK
ncbi:MAG: hypothetical protein IPJ38_08450 [Dechloromonas sp.]|jgi:hypothetical protein|uniref:Uncharacterized protein n=1 Tax=Candidatus Dechloromonas phosphorivorans TaxID=2899244 RepID=A0A935KAB9_9RHOO|nr:hypothetical protein [Candidatus Dechloromonas phosphorivorans]